MLIFFWNIVLSLLNCVINSWPKQTKLRAMDINLSSLGSQRSTVFDLDKLNSKVFWFSCKLQQEVLQNSLRSNFMTADKAFMYKKKNKSFL